MDGNSSTCARFVQSDGPPCEYIPGHSFGDLISLKSPPISHGVLDTGLICRIPFHRFLLSSLVLLPYTSVKSILSPRVFFNLRCMYCWCEIRMSITHISFLQKVQIELAHCGKLGSPLLCDSHSVPKASFIA